MPVKKAPGPHLLLCGFPSAFYLHLILTNRPFCSLTVRRSGGSYGVIRARIEARMRGDH
jgi:hypothetical protein